MIDFISLNMIITISRGTLSGNDLSKKMRETETQLILKETLSWSGFVERNI